MHAQGVFTKLASDAVPKMDYASVELYARKLSGLSAKEATFEATTAIIVSLLHVGNYAKAKQLLPVEATYDRKNATHVVAMTKLGVALGEHNLHCPRKNSTNITDSCEGLYGKLDEGQARLEAGVTHEMPMAMLFQCHFLTKLRQVDAAIHSCEKVKHISHPNDYAMYQMDVATLNEIVGNAMPCLAAAGNVLRSGTSDLRLLRQAVAMTGRVLTFNFGKPKVRLCSHCTKRVVLQLPVVPGSRTPIPRCRVCRFVDIGGAAPDPFTRFYVGVEAIMGYRFC